MKLAIISDVHLGDPMGTLIKIEEQNGKKTFSKGEKYDDFKNEVGTDNDYLILLGDILDFSIADYKDAYEAGKCFFKQIKNDHIAKQMIYIPGNHDFDLWHTVEYQTNIINPLIVGKEVRQFRMSVPGVLDDRDSSETRSFYLPHVTRKTTRGKPYGGLFLDYITGNKVQERTLFNFAYPNLYMITNDGRSILITHGQYFETYWALTGDWAKRIFKEDLPTGDSYNLYELVAINFPLSQLTCSGTGQAGPLTKVIEKIQRDFKDKKLTDIEKYLDNLKNEVDNETNFGKKFWKEMFWDAVSGLAVNKIKDTLKHSVENEIPNTARENRDFARLPDVQKRMKSFYLSSLNEIAELNRAFELNIPNPEVIIWGHTHVIDKWNSVTAPSLDFTGATPKKVSLYNSGGWLKCKKDGNIQFEGAEVFIYKTDVGFSSVTIK